MSVKNNLILAAAAVVATGLVAPTAFAGGGDPFAAPAAQPKASSGPTQFYVQLGGSFADTDYDSDDDGGFGFHGLIGYQFMPAFSAELGAMFLPSYTPAADGSDEITSNIYFLSGKYSYGVMNNLDVFAKAGVGMRTIKDSDSDSYVSGLFGAGVSYDLMTNLYVTGEVNYMMKGSASKTTIGASDDVHAVLMYGANLGYRF